MANVLTQTREPDPEEDPIINVRLTPEDFVEAVNTHEKNKEEWLARLRLKHIEPTQRQAALIEKVCNAIEEKLLSYGFDVPALRRNKPDIIFLSRKDYWQEKYGKEENSSNPDTLGFYEPSTNTVILWYKQHGGQTSETKNFSIPLRMNSSMHTACVLCRRIRKKIKREKKKN